MPLKPEKPNSWVVIHCEAAGQTKTGFSISTLPYHVSSSLRKAESFIRKRGPGHDADSWWEIRGFIADDDDSPVNDDARVENVRYYSYTGKRIDREVVSKLMRKCVE